MLRALRRRWWLVLLIVLTCGAIAYGAVTLVRPRYTATAQLFVAAASSDSGLGSSTLQGLYAGDLFTQNRVQSYVDVVRNTPVMQAAIHQVGSSIAPATLANETAVDAPAGTVLINIHVTDVSPVRAERFANAIAHQFILFDQRLERTRPSVSPIKISVSQPATRPTAPSSPNRTLDLGIALFVGLLIGVATVVGIDLADTRLRSAEQLRDLTDAPVLGNLPVDRSMLKARRIIDVDEHSPQAESYRTLRTSVRFMQVDAPPKTIVVTSPQPGDGKTTTACNLAAVYADAGMRVLLVDADLRAPTVPLYFGFDRATQGLTDSLRDSAAKNCVHECKERRNLYILPSGAIPPNPSELLSSTRMRSFVERVRDEYDMVIFDASPLLPVTDALVLSTVCDSVLVVARYGATRTFGLKRALEMLDAAGARVLGLVVNAAPGGSSDYGYYGAPYDAASQEAAMQSS